MAVLDALFSTGWLPLLGFLFAALMPTVPPGTADLAGRGWPGRVGLLRLSPKGVQAIREEVARADPQAGGWLFDSRTRAEVEHDYAGGPLA